MSVDEVVAALDAMDVGDPESAHGKADDLMLSIMPTAIQDAHARLVERCRWWAGA